MFKTLSPSVLPVGVETGADGQHWARCRVEGLSLDCLPSQMAPAQRRPNNAPEGSVSLTDVLLRPKNPDPNSNPEISNTDKEEKVAGSLLAVQEARPCRLPPRLPPLTSRLPDNH